MTASFVRIPAGPITPHGAYHILHDRIPQMTLTSYDKTVVTNMLGGAAIADKFAAPGRVEVKSLKGLIPPWRTIDQKGATEDGVTNVTSLYDPAEIELDTRVKGANPADARKIYNYLVASIDAKEESELSWCTHELGRWWANVRWFKTPTDPIGAIKDKTQDCSLRLRADHSFWQSYPCVDSFYFTYEDDTDTFDVENDPGLGAGWTLAYSGTGGGYIRSHNSQAEWVDDPDDPILTGGRTVVGRRVGYTSTTDNQVVSTVIGTFPEWSFPDNAGNDLWGRMNNTGTPGTTGIRVRFGIGKITLSYFNSGVEHVLRERFLLIPPLPGEKFTLVCGYEGDPRMFKVMRNGLTIMSVKEGGTGSSIGASYRSSGAGMFAAPALITQATPASMRKWSAGDNAAVTQSGFVRCVNVGDQDMWETYTVFGPGTFRFWNGPNASGQDYVEFGPVLQNQVMHIRTDPRRRGVVNLTQVPPSPQQLDLFQKALSDFLNFATGNNATPLAEEIKSQFGILPPQGNPYSLLKGRWNVPIPKKPAGRPAKEHFIKVEIVNGNADSQIIASGTPLRRLPY